MSNIRLTWDDAGAIDEGYDIYRSETTNQRSSSGMELIGSTDKDTFEFVDDTFEVLTDNYYRIASKVGSRKKFSQEYHVPSWTPINLFKNGELGVWYDPSDEGTLYQDSAGTIPVVNDGDPVGLMLDKSKGLEYGSELSTNGTFDTDSSWTKGTGWIISDGVASKTTSDNTSIFQSTSLVNGKWYVLSFEIVTSSISSGLRVFYNGLVDGNFINSPGKKQFIFLSNGNQSYGLNGASFTGGAVDNISIKELKGNHATQPVSASRPLFRRGDNRGIVNRLKWSEAFDNSVWVKSGIYGVTPNITTAPNGELTADKLYTLNGSSSGSGGIIQYTKKPKTQIKYTVSVRAKAAERNSILVYVNGDSSANACEFGFNLATQTVSHNNIYGGFSSTSTPKITNLGNGWYQCEKTFTTNSDESLNVRVYPYNNGSPYTGDGSSGIYVWGIQIEEGDKVSSYQRNDVHLGGVAGDRRGDGRGTVNHLTWTESFNNSYWTKYNVTASSGFTDPEGGSTAWRIVDDATNSQHLVRVSATPGSESTMRSYSIYVKAGTARYILFGRIFSGISGGLLVFDTQTGSYSDTGSSLIYDTIATPVNAGNGWWKLSFSSDSDSILASQFLIGINNGPTHESDWTYSGSGNDIYIWHPQMEIGSSVTDYQKNTDQIIGVGDIQPDDIRWLEFDGVDDYMTMSVLASKVTMATSARVLTGTGSGTRGLISPKNLNYLAYNGTTFYVFDNEHELGTTVRTPDNSVDVEKEFVAIHRISDTYTDIVFDGITYNFNKNNTVTSRTYSNLGSFDNTSLFAKAAIYSAVVVNEDIGNYEVSLLEAYLANKSGLYSDINEVSNITYDYV